MSVRNVASVAADAPDAIGVRLLDAAGHLVATRGLKGLTIAELAREAEVSRPTVYRRFRSSDDVVRALLGHRATLLVAQASHEARRGAHAPDRAAIVAGVLAFGDLFRADPVFRRLLRREPEVFTRYTLQRIGRSQRVIHEWIAAALAAAQEGGSVRAGDPHDMALMVLIVSQGALLSGPTVADLVDPDAWRAELAHALDAYLRP
ncbi:TetR/AcrR family transcriptional regulator [Myceligenerans pegani]|uniref:TetR/AcrR family transcriptional regulator n=1 Tax=Myceligenerans pegani TaxID=2776917 RepID=A0ABR9N1Z3_9MICO|nr:TetR/AcrR family transcriptional regulator [Myceligenerans sp. TRM 65318]MBE1877685.1 TetR/AcrR family transcriptional regulator [Myceligenerans sp. TRM 65318]MBE3019956.1 TetR/AcrR family transcriptional regulator [Myceligenerans sp. TRM 65318]